MKYQFASVVVLSSLVLAACGSTKHPYDAKVDGQPKWSGRVTVPPVGPDGAPAKGLPARPLNPAPEELPFLVEIKVEGAPRAYSYGFQQDKFVKCEATAPSDESPNGLITIVFARDVNGRKQEAILRVSPKNANTGKAGTAQFSIALAKGLTVKAETGDTLTSYKNEKDAKAFSAQYAMEEGQMAGTFSGSIEGQTTGLRAAVSGSFRCAVSESK